MRLEYHKPMELVELNMPRTYTPDSPFPPACPLSAGLRHLYMYEAYSVIYFMVAYGTLIFVGYWRVY